MNFQRCFSNYHQLLEELNGLEADANKGNLSRAGRAALLRRSGEKDKINRIQKTPLRAQTATDGAGDNREPVMRGCW